MTVVALEEIAEVNPRSNDKPWAEDPVAFVPMAELDAVSAVTSGGQTRPFADVSKGYTLFRDRDLLVAKITPCFENNKIGQARLDHPVGAGSSEFHVVRPNSNLVDDRYLLHFLRQDRIRAEGELRMTGSGGQRRIPPAFLKGLRIPLPPLEQQRRLAAILDRAQTLLAARRRARAHLGQLTKSIFLEMFGDPTAPGPHASLPLSEVCKPRSGGTPSKNCPDFWDGRIPWFSPKDIKSSDINDSALHVSASALERSRLSLVPADTVVLVVRGMILAHTVPVSIIRSAGTVNQDLKALIPQVPIEVDFLASCIRAQHDKILASVATSAHGTKRLDSASLGDIQVLRPGESLEREFAERARSVREASARALRSEHLLSELAKVLEVDAYSGAL